MVLDLVTGTCKTSCEAVLLLSCSKQQDPSQRGTHLRAPLAVVLPNTCCKGIHAACVAQVREVPEGGLQEQHSTLEMLSEQGPRALRCYIPVPFHPQQPVPRPPVPHLRRSTPLSASLHRPVRRPPHRCCLTKLARPSSSLLLMEQEELLFHHQTMSGRCTAFLCAADDRHSKRRIWHQ